MAGRGSSSPSWPANALRSQPTQGRPPTRRGGAKARLHTRDEVPFYTGRRKPVSELLAMLP
jgi:hypothetical protein